MRFFYSAVLYLVAPLVLVRLLWRSRSNPDYRRRWIERLGFVPYLPGKPRIWVHAVSVGETVAAAPLLKRLQQTYPEHAILVTTTTPTGSRQVRRSFGSTVEHCYFPYDLPSSVARFLTRVHPNLLVIMETEIWPNLYDACGRRHIPIVLANARLSERSAEGYRKLRRLVSQTLTHLSAIAAQGQEDANRFIHLGAAPEKVAVTGNIKFDLELPPDIRAEGQALRAELCNNRPVWIAASTHAGEDEQVLEAFLKVRDQVPEAFLILVPRHPERFDSVARLCEKQGFSVVRRSTRQSSIPGAEILLGDTMGELLLFYAASDVAFVGGSLVATGGHNPLEPAALGVPILTGPHTFNFAEIFPPFFKLGAAQQIKEPRSLAEAVSQLLKNPQERTERSRAAYQIVEQNRGASQRLLKMVDCFIN